MRSTPSFCTPSRCVPQVSLPWAPSTLLPVCASFCASPSLRVKGSLTGDEYSLLCPVGFRTAGVRVFSALWRFKFGTSSSELVADSSRLRLHALSLLVLTRCPAHARGPCVRQSRSLPATSSSRRDSFRVNLGIILVFNVLGSIAARFLREK
ncbi:hypothetical protein FB451DRAFT_289494 [Mycena latifolia]|nr:hypothetical protein FB451DRAFT_289494 [Mycena latifolia]